MTELAQEDPQFPHRCTNCVFLGRWSPPYTDVELKDFDLYYCTKGPGPTVIARYGALGHEYTSGMALADAGLPDLAEAKRRAMAMGLIKE